MADMDMLTAFRLTIALATERGMPEGEGDVGLAHLRDMQRRLHENMSDAKLGRWLGWAQACVVAAGYATLDEMKELNRKLSISRIAGSDEPGDMTTDNPRWLKDVLHEEPEGGIFKPQQSKSLNVPSAPLEEIIKVLGYALATIEIAEIKIGHPMVSGEEVRALLAKLKGTPP